MQPVPLMHRWSRCVRVQQLCLRHPRTPFSFVSLRSQFFGDLGLNPPLQANYILVRHPYYRHRKHRIMTYNRIGPSARRRRCSTEKKRPTKIAKKAPDVGSLHVLAVPDDGVQACRVLAVRRCYHQPPWLVCICSFMVISLRVIHSFKLVLFSISLFIGASFGEQL